jgi:hypothetical protein
MRNIAIATIGLAACATLVFGQTRDPGSERTQQPAGQSGAAVSHTLTPDVPAQPHEITTTSTPSVSLTADQRNRLKAYFTKAGARDAETDKAFTVAIGAAVPKQVDLQPFASELKTILPTYKGDQYVLVGDRLVIATPERRIVAIIPGVRS